MRNKYRIGFTLIEMLIVIAIIAILAGIIFVGIPGFRNNAFDSRRIADMRNVQNALELFYAKCRFYPNGGAGADCGGLPADGDLTWSELTNILVGANIGIKSLPTEPVSGWPNYQYTAVSEGASAAQRYVLGTKLSADRDVFRDPSTIVAQVGGINCGIADLIYCIGSGN